MALAPLLGEVLGAPPGAGYTRQMLDRIAEYQTSVELVPDGIVGRNTRLKLEKQGYLDAPACPGLWPESNDAGEQTAHYLKLIGAPAPSELPLLIGLRGVYTFARRAHRLIHAMRYDDTFVLLVPGQPPEVFPGATHAYEVSSSKAPGGSVGSIRPGTYFLTIATENPIQFHLLMADRKTGDIPAYRDTNHDGFVSADEMERSLSATQGKQVASGVGMFANQVLFHPGYDDPKHPRSSIACQTASPNHLARLRQVGTQIDYVLKNAVDVARATAPSTLPQA